MIDEFERKKRKNHTDFEIVMCQEELSRALATAVLRAVKRAIGEAFLGTENPSSIPAGTESRK